MAGAKDETWVPYSAPRFGIQDILLPEGNGIAGLGDDRIYGGYNGTPGRFEIKLLHSSAQVARQREMMEQTTSNEDDVVDPLSHTDFKVEVADKVSFACSVCFGDRGENSDTEHMVLLKSPSGHGLFISLTAPSPKLDFVKDLAKRMLQSLKWADRRLLFAIATSEFAGSWRCTSTLPAERNFLKPGCTTVTTEDINFDAEGDYSYTKVHAHTAGGGEEETEIGGFAVGKFEAYRDQNRRVSLLTMDEQTGQDECVGVELRGDKMIKGGKEWARVVEQEVEDL